ncbi:unnamed protein product [Sphagnum jensenii]|uniref:ETFB lysine methyltransferase n=1 Tax=Sphagnum jensenii TaxID=128206 RepID=A0ABP0WSR2_9BRYO
MRREEGAREEDRQTEMRPPLRLLSMLSAHSSSFKPSLAVSIAGEDVAKALAMAADSVGLTEMPQYEVVNTEEIDWVQQVQCQFKPIEVAKGLWIVPKWSTPPDPEALNVMLNLGLAFGTGEHPTTCLCL